MATENVELALFEGTGISEEDKRDVLEQIDKVVEENKIPVTKDLFLLKPRRKGVLFPVMINLLAILLVAGGLYAAFLYFAQKQENLSTETERYLSTEGKLIEELKKESETKLKAKEAEISKIQSDLAELDKQSQDLRNSMEDTIKSKEEELRTALEVELEAERKKLQSQGVSATRIEEQIKALEESKRQELNQAIASFRQESETALQQKEQELQQAKNLAQEILTKANQDKITLQAETQKREAELQAKYEQETSTLKSQSAEAQAKLKELSDLRAQEQLFLDQVTGSYAAIQRKIAADDFDGARADLAKLKTILDDRAFDTLPNLVKRKTVELFIVQSLSENLDTRTTSASPETASIVDAANKLIGARELTARADEAMKQGKLEDAKRQYTKALQDVPAMFAASEGLRNIRNVELAAQAELRVKQADEAATSGKEGPELFEEYKAAVLLAAGPASSQAASALTKFEALLSDKYADERTEAVGKKDTIIADLEKRLKQETTALQQETDLKQQTAEKLAVAEAGKTEAEKDLADRIAELRKTKTSESDLQKEITASRQDIEKLTADLTKSKTETAALQKTVADLNKNLGSLQGDTSGQQSLITQLRSQVEDKNREIQRLTGDLQTKTNEIASLSNRLSMSSAPAIAAVSPETLNAERSAAEKKGRDQALADVIAYVDLRAKNTEAVTPSERRKIETLAARDFLYKTALERIETIAAAGSTGAGGASVGSVARVEPKLIGTVASVSPGRIIVEPLVNMQILSGAKLIVKRKTRTSGEITIANGTVANTTAGRITAQIDLVANQEQQPMVMDLVYMEI